MSRPENIWAIVPAAGSGVRMQAGVPKQYLLLLDRPVILHTLGRLCAYPRVNGVLVGIAPDDSRWNEVRTSNLPNFLGDYLGGTTRARTVLNGLVSLAGRAADDDWVMVHDAVRPCVRNSDLDKLIEAASGSPDGALLASPISDTIKRSDADARVQETVARAGLWRAATPQIFRLSMLRKALTEVVARNEDVTDDSAAVERFGARPRIVECAPDNIKITRPGDLQLAEIFLQQQREAAT